MNFIYYCLLILNLDKEDKILLNFDNLLTNLTGYIETKVELTKVEVKEAVSNIAAKAILYGILFFISLFTFIFLCLTIAGLINELLNSRFIGHAVVTLVFILISVVLFSMRDKILKFLANKTVSMFNDPK